MQQLDKDMTSVVRVMRDGFCIFCIEPQELNGMHQKGERKHYVDEKLYHALFKETQTGLSWGILTGIRPTKIAMQKMGEGLGKEQFIKWFQEYYLVSAQKAGLTWEIARREKILLSSLDYKNGYSLYIGIPFCPSVCTYCSFSSGSLSAWHLKVDAYLDALCREVAYIGKNCKGKSLNTIYIGGGTPTTLSAEQLERLLACVHTNFAAEHLLEYTVEAGRPDSITEEKLRVLRKYSVTRISINPQTMQQKTLDKVGRRHSVEQVVSSFHMARELGFDNINMDLIAGLPGENESHMADTLRQLEELLPDSLTVHALSIKRAAQMNNEDIKNVAGDIDAMLKIAGASAKKMGILPYYLYRQKNIAGNFENVGYAKVDKAGIYNILIMEEKQSIIAAGAGASTKIVLKNPVQTPGAKKKKKTNLIRIENVKAIDAYIARIDEMIERKGEWLWR